MSKKNYVLRALSDSHLRAIGKVAAQWSSLEFYILRAVAEIAHVEHETVLMMLAAQGFSSWCEILAALSGETTPKPKPKTHKPTEIEAHLTELGILHAHRNKIVHCSWSAPFG